MPQYIAVPTAQVVADKITSLSGAVVRASDSVSVTGGSYRVFATADVSDPFTPTGGSTPGPAIISGALPDQILIAPAANFSVAEELLSLAGCYVTTSGTVTGLVGNTSYRAVGLTIPSEEVNVTTVPDVFTAWSVADAQLGGALTFTFTTMPYNGLSAITDIYIYQNGSTTPIPTGRTTAGTFTLFNLTNDVSYSFTVAAVNAVGVAALSTAKTATPTNVPVVVPPGTQIATFGSLTLANAGRFQPVDSVGNVLTVTGISPSTGGAVLVNGGLAFSTAGGGTDGATYTLTTSAGAITCQISKQANAYSVASYAQMLSAESAASASGGWTILCRRGGGADYTSTGRTTTRVYTNRAYIIGEGSWTAPDANGVGTYSADVVFEDGIDIRASNLTVRNLRLKGIGVDLFGTARGIHVENCHMGAEPIEWQFEYPAGSTGTSLGLPYAGIRSGGTDHAGLEVRQCLFEFSELGLTIKQNSPIRCVFEYNEIRHLLADTMKLGGSTAGMAAGYIHRYNYSWGFMDTAGSGNNTIHADAMIQTSGVTSYTEHLNAQIYGNVMNASFGGDERPQVIFIGSDGNFPRLFRGGCVVGNVFATGGNHHCTMQSDDIVVRNNTFVRDTPSVAGTSPARFLAGSDTLNNPFKTGYCIVENNIFEEPAGLAGGTQTITENNNAYLGNMGKNSGVEPQTLVNYDVMFPNYNDGAQTVEYDTFINKYRPSDPTKGYGASTGITYGQPRQIAGWNVPASLLVP